MSAPDVLKRDGDISLLNIDVRTRNCLRSEQLHHISEVRKTPPNYLRRIPNLGPLSFKRLQQAIAEFDEAATTTDAYEQERKDRFAAAALIGYLSNPNFDAHMSGADSAVRIAWGIAEKMVAHNRDEVRP